MFNGFRTLTVVERTSEQPKWGRRFTSLPVLHLIFAGIAASLLLPCFLNLASAGDVNFKVQGEPSIGWNGNYLVGRWTPVRVPVQVEGIVPGDNVPVPLELSAVDPDGNRVRFHSSDVKLTEESPGVQYAEGVIKVGRLDSDIGVSTNGSESEKRYPPSKNGSLKFPLLPSTRLIITVGQPHGFDFESEGVKIASVKPAELSENPLAYDGVTSLVLAGTERLTQGRSESIRDWVAAGGRLVISLPLDVAKAAEVLPSWVPVQVGPEPVIVREFGGLEAFSGKNLRMPQTSTLSIPQMTYESGEVLAATRSIPFLIRAPYGMGSVTVLAMDLTTNPLRDWKGLSPFCARLTGATSTNVDLTDRSAGKGSQLSSTGITDLSTQLHAVQENFESIQRVSPWMVMGWLLALLIVVGPIDYAVVHRVLKKPLLTWVTFPIFAAISGLLASSLASRFNGETKRANQLNIVNVDVASGLVHSRHFVNVYHPSTSQLSMTVEPQALISDPRIKPSARIVWDGIPESTFGGMLRERGIERGATYHQQANGELTDVPVIQWSSKSLVGDSVTSAEGLIESNLKATVTGSLSGTIIHRFAAPIEDWMVVYQNRVYRSLKTRDDTVSLPWAPRTVWRVEQPGNFQRELRPYLTGILTMATPKFGTRPSNEPFNQMSAYDSLSRDPFTLIRMLTFHDDVGGERYTGLTNQMLNDQDLSHLLKLGRAVLFGRINQPIAAIQIDRETLKPDRESSFVRLILPVARSGELLKDLKRVVPD